MIDVTTIGDGNGGRLDPSKITQRDLLVALHVKVDRLLEDVRDHEERLRRCEFRLWAIPGVGVVTVTLGAAALIFHF